MLRRTIREAINKRATTFFARHFVTHIQIPCAKVDDDAKQNPWELIGFDVINDRFQVGGVTIDLLTNGQSNNMIGLGLSNLDDDITTQVDGIPVWKSSQQKLIQTDENNNSNKVSHLDHIVVRSHNILKTKHALSIDLNLTLRRETQDIYPGMTHLFYKEPNQTNTPIVEVIGPTASKKDGAYVWGLTFVSPKIAFTQKHIGSEYTSVIRNAKQKDRQIFTLRHKLIPGISTNVAFISPHCHHTKLQNR
jgi:hypothetical protein